jgi:hypothetical protein
LHPDEAQAHIAVPVALDVDETRPEIVDLALAQAAGLTCIWGGSDRTDGGYGQGVQLRILPDAASAFAAWQASGPPDYCQGSTTGDPVFCDVQFLVGDSWVELDLRDVADVDKADPKGAATAVAALIRGRLQSARPTTAWTVPGSVLTPVADCAARTADAASIVGVDPASISARSESLEPSVSDAARARVHERSCSWADAGYSSSLSWDVLPGGAWAFGGFDRPQQIGLIAPLRPATVPGASQAWIGCADACVAVLSVRGSLVISSTDSGLDDSVVVQRAARAVAAFAG